MSRPLTQEPPRPNDSNAARSGDGGPTVERIIPASRRPDGSLRKEIRVRAGYVPLEEMEKYQPRGTVAKSSTPGLPPGLDPEMLKPQKSKKKKKKKKKGGEEGREGEEEEAEEEREREEGGEVKDRGRGEQMSEGGGRRTDASHSLSQLSLSEGDVGRMEGRDGDREREGVRKGQERRGEAKGREEASPPCASSSEREKRARNLRKKIRQAETLSLESEKRILSAEEGEKVSKLEEWKRELSLLIPQ